MHVPAPVVPRYGEATIAELFPSVLAALGVRGERNVLRLATADRGCVLLVDGLGRSLLRAYADEAPYLASLRDATPITSCAPSTTPTSITSLGTGLAPGAHGVLGFKVRVPGELRLLNHLHWSDRIDPVTWQPHPTMFGRATAAGLPAFSVGPEAFRTTGLTVAASRGASYIGAATAAELAEAAGAALARVSRGVAYVYWSAVDVSGHVYGVGSEEWRSAVRAVDELVRGLVDRLPREASLWVTADHGMVDVPEDGKIDAEVVPALADDVVLLGGEPRFRHVYARGGAAGDVLAAWREELAGRAWVVSREEAIANGWFGPSVDRALLPRIGDVLAVAYGTTAIVAPRGEPQTAALVGYHGSLTRAELEIPLKEIRVP